MTEPSTPMPPHFDLDDKYTRTDGTVMLTGIQAIVRVPIDQARLDASAGRKTGTFISGYPGSPLGVLDKALDAARAQLDVHDVVHHPAVNEETAAVAVWGSQQTPRPYSGGRTGVLGIWYGKAPGVDRSGDSFRHGNFMGVHPAGGVLALAGDDPSAKSSTLPTDSQSSFYDLAFPIIVPSSIQEILDLGLYAVSLSRYSGNWVGIKMVTNLCDGLATVQVRSNRQIVSPFLEIDGKAWHHHQLPSVLTPISLEQEAELFGARLMATKAHLEVNGINKLVRHSPRDRLGIVGYGKPFADLMEALNGLERSHGTDFPPLRILKLGASYPLPEPTVREFAAGLSEIIVIEEKRSFVETQVKEILYAASERPAVLGKRGRDGDTLVPISGELNQQRIVDVLRRWLEPHVPGIEDESPRPQIALKLLANVSAPKRAAAYCSGCPHSRSTVIPEGALSGGGCGCHSLIYTEPRHTDDDLFSVVPMGTEGAQWIGLAPFVDTKHMFQNIGDGTYFHSGVNAVRACIDSGVTLTFKLLFNSAIAMTGGQHVPGTRGVEALSQELHAMGVVRTIICTDNRSNYRRRKLPANTTVLPRERLDEAQRELAGNAGVTVLLFDQHCAAEARRLRKRGKMATPTARVVIHERVCEGCGDCQTKSNCLSVIPVSTELGRKTQVHDPSCNRDYSCLSGDCPSFITVVPRRRKRSAGRSFEPPAVAEPVSRAVVPSNRDEAFNLILAGIGGTGVMTVNQILAVAALLDGHSCVGLDQTGLSQKAGPVLSHLRISRALATTLPGALAAGTADTFLAFDPIVAVSETALACLAPSRTAAMVNADLSPTRDMIVDATKRDGVAVERLTRTIADACIPGRTETVAALRVAESIFADSMPQNLLLVGAAYQAGLIPLSRDSIHAAIAANGVSVSKNIAAFEWGRHAQSQEATVDEPSRLGRIPMNPGQTARTRAEKLAANLRFPERLPAGTLDYAAELVEYGGVGPAGRYLALVATAVEAERRSGRQTAEFSVAVARNFFKVLAAKDEYEVARLLSDKRLRRDIREQVGSAAIYYHLHPPLLRALGMKRKLRIRSTWATPLFTVLKMLRPLRGTALDPFGMTAVRRREREFAADYERAIEQAANLLSRDPERSLAIAALPEDVRGYESIKESALDIFEHTLGELLAQPVDAATVQAAS